MGGKGQEELYNQYSLMKRLFPLPLFDLVLEAAVDALAADEAADVDSTDDVFAVEPLLAEDAAAELLAAVDAAAELAADDAATADELAALVDAPFPDLPVALLAERIAVDDAETAAADDEAVVTCETTELAATEAVELDVPAAAVELAPAAPSVTVK